MLMLAPSFLRLATLVLLVAPAVAQTPGSVFVVNRFGEHSDGNAFVRNDGAYLSAGPGGGCAGLGACGDPGLSTGDWYFQITDPAGTVLLTTDAPAERRVHVDRGVITQYLGSTRLSGGRGVCKSLRIRMVPFADSPDPIREYKVWMTRVEDFDPSGAKVFGFDPLRSKCDDFRVNVAGPQAIVRGHAFYDEDESGTWEPVVHPLEVALGGWRVELLRNGVLDGYTYADADGAYTFVRDRDGAAYTVRQVAPGGFIDDAVPGAVWHATTAREVAVTLSAECSAGPEFGAVAFELLPGSGRTSEFWSAHGCGHPEHPDTGDDDHGPPASCGHPLLEDCDPVWRTALTTRNGLPVNLRRPVSTDVPALSIFHPLPLPEDFEHSFQDWRQYARRNPHDHAGFLLSREVAATILSNTCGYMQGSIYIDRHQDGVLVSLDTMLAGAIGLLSETGAGLTGPNDPFLDLRQRMLMCLNEFGTINLTGDPGTTQVVYGRRMTPPGFQLDY